MKILIYQENNRGGHTDIFRTLDYGTLYTYGRIQVIRSGYKV